MRLAARVGELRFAGGEEHVAGQGDGAAGGIDRGGDIRLAQGAGKIGDDLRAHAHQVLDLLLLLLKLALLRGDLALLRRRCCGPLACALQLRLLLVQLRERLLQLRFLRVQFFLRLVRRRLRRLQQHLLHGQVFLRGGQLVLRGVEVVLRGGQFVLRGC